MFKRAHPIQLCTLVFIAFALLGYSQLWAKPPCERERIFDDRIKVEFDEDCENVTGVWFYEDGDWKEAIPDVAVMCICSGEDCVDDSGGGIDENIILDNDPKLDVYVECHVVKDTGPKSSGCPVYLNPDRYFFGGTYYRR